MKIPFNISITSSSSTENVNHLVENPFSISEKIFTKLCMEWFQKLYPEYKALLITSCTKAMELIALSINIQEGDEIIMPSFSYVGVANSFANLGAKLVLQDIDPETMNIDSNLLESAITAKTKAVVIMHYGGVTCEMEKIVEICKRRNIILIEDNAQGIGGTYHDIPLGSFGDFSCISFDSLKNISCGEGGVLLYKKKFEKSVAVCFENGTNRNDFSEGKVEYYEWVDRGSKFAISEFNAAILYPLLLNTETITDTRKERWQKLYDSIFQEEKIKHLLTPKLLLYNHNAHIFFLKCAHKKERDTLMKFLNSKEISCSFHYTPLHSSVQGKKLGLHLPDDKHTTKESERLLRLPMYNSLSDSDIEYIIENLVSFFKIG
jgi:dTDP-4-amino-4,6-dideoxygalactose transaminase